MANAPVAGELLKIGDVAVEIHRKGTGAPLLILHGENGAEANAEYLDLLATQYAVLLPAHPGFEHSPLPDNFDTIDDLAYLYLDLLDALGLEQVNVLGIGFGGWLALELATKNARRLARIVLVDPVGVKFGDRETRDIQDIWGIPPDELRRLTWHDPAKGQIDVSQLNDDELLCRARNIESTARYCWEPYMHNPKLRQRLHRITVPTLLIYGASDRLVTANYGEQFARAIPGARHETIPEAGHSPQIEQPAALAERVSAFLG